jgi:cytochrome c peroxidase
MKNTAIILLALCTPYAQAATPTEVLTAYRAEAMRLSPGYQMSAELGEHLYNRRFSVSDKMPACNSCHTSDPTRVGRHVVTDKVIRPLSPSANAGRFTDPGKVEKWFRRNCTEVVGRECSAAEKADFIAFVMGVR